MRLVQLKDPQNKRRIALVEEPNLLLIHTFPSIYDAAMLTAKGNGQLQETILRHRSTDYLNYDEVYHRHSDWQLLPAFDHPKDPNACFVAGTGLTHKASAENRQNMHDVAAEKELTDSMKMYLWGVEGGHPTSGRIGVQPEWFYKGNGSVLRAHGEALSIPPYGEDGGEEPEVAGIYIVDFNGVPRRVGFATSNEFSDHVMEKRNYLYLAPSKIRQCSIGPELCLTTDFQDIRGKVAISRGREVIWRQDIKSGEENMAHSLSNLEYHHFKYENHRLPGQAHVHFFGADAFSFGEQISLEENDVMEVHWHALGRPLRNTLQISTEEEEMFTIDSL